MQTLPTPIPSPKPSTKQSIVPSSVAATDSAPSPFPPIWCIRIATHPLSSPYPQMIFTRQDESRATMRDAG